MLTGRFNKRLFFAQEGNNYDKSCICIFKSTTPVKTFLHMHLQQHMGINKDKICLSYEKKLKQSLFV